MHVLHCCGHLCRIWRDICRGHIRIHPKSETCKSRIRINLHSFAPSQSSHFEILSLCRWGETSIPFQRIWNCRIAILVFFSNPEWALYYNDKYFLPQIRNELISLKARQKSIRMQYVLGYFACKEKRLSDWTKPSSRFRLAIGCAIKIVTFASWLHVHFLRLTMNFRSTGMNHFCLPCCVSCRSRSWHLELKLICSNCIAHKQKRIQFVFLSTVAFFALRKEQTNIIVSISGKQSDRIQNER